MKILADRSSELSGADIKSIVESIVISESIQDAEERKKQEMNQKEINLAIEEWRNGKAV